LVSSYFLIGATTDGPTINIKITNIRSTKGRIELQVYKDKESFAKEVPYKVYFIPKESLKEKTLTYKIKDIPNGTYGFAILDDENQNRKMDYSFMIPQEGFGFSNYYHTAWSKPKFESFKFVLSGDTSVDIKVRYV